jgi:periplasmic protein TonB
LQVPNLPYPNYGDPNAPKLTNSAGPGFGDGFGEKGPGGVGPKGKGRGYGREEEGYGDAAVPGLTPGVTYPECEYCPLPAYSDDARKEKLQGPVEIRLVVTADGRATNLRVVRGLGLGLDERALEAVRKWHFRPSRDAAGRPTAAWVTVEVTFRLL